MSELIVKYGERCPKCGLSSCDHNEDPVDPCEVARRKQNPQNYWLPGSVEYRLCLENESLKAEVARFKAELAQQTTYKKENESLKANQITPEMIVFELTGEVRKPDETDWWLARKTLNRGAMLTAFPILRRRPYVEVKSV